MLRIFFVTIVMLLLPGIEGQKVMAQLTQQVHIQEKAGESIQSESLDSLIYEIFFGDDELNRILNKKENFHFLYFRSSYSTKTFYAGREIGTDQYNLIGQLYYLHSKGFYAGVSGAWYSQLDPRYRTTTLSIGYSRGLKKTNILGYRTSFNVFFFNIPAPDFDPDYNCSVNTGLTLRNNWLGTRLDGSLLLGKETGIQFFWSTYARVRLLRLNKLDKIQLEPQFGLFLGPEVVAEENSTTPEEYLDMVPVNYRNIFGLLNTQVEIPLTISWKSFDFEFSWIRNFPHSLDKTVSYPQNNYFEFGIGYVLNLGRI